MASKSTKGQTQQIPDYDSAINKSAPKLVGLSKSISDLNDRLEEMAEFLAVRRQPIMITGGSGLGKRVLAESILKIAEEKHKVKSHLVDCTALEKELMRSELFGHEKGAFTGATRKKKGLLVEAGSDIIFLDEIGDLPDDIKRKLLIAFEGRGVRPVGSALADAKPISFALISATNRDVTDPAVMPKDLYHRIADWHIYIPDLCDRKIDIVPCICKIVEEIGENSHRKRYCWKVRNLFDIMDYGWKNGGYRELRNEITFLLREGRLSPAFRKKSNTREIDNSSTAPQFLRRAKSPLRQDLEDYLPSERGKYVDSLRPIKRNFESDLIKALTQCNLFITPEEMLNLLRAEIDYYREYAPPDHDDPRVYFNTKVFFFGLIQPYQSLNPLTYVPYVSYKKDMASPIQEKYSFIYARDSFAGLKKPTGEISEMKIPDEAAIMMLLSKYSYAVLDKNIKKAIYKIKLQQSLTWPQVEKRFELRYRKIKKAVKKTK